MVTKVVKKNVAIPKPQVTPSITLTGKEVDQIFADLTSPLLFQKQPNGAITPLLEPGVQRVALLLQAKAIAAKET